MGFGFGSAGGAIACALVPLLPACQAARAPLAMPLRRPPPLRSEAVAGARGAGPLVVQ
jgi:hypothetical protein